MEQLKHTKPQEMGETTSPVFAGEYASQTTKEMYADTPAFFAEEMRKRLSPNQEYTVADIGAHEGQLLEKIAENLPEYKLKSVAIDTNERALKINSAATKIIARAEQLPLKDKSVDIALMRYVLQWNTEEDQKKILSEIARVIKNFGIIEHISAPSEDSDAWRKQYDELLNGKDVPKLKRNGYYYSSRAEIEMWMKSMNIHFERIRERKIEDATNAYGERYNLNQDEYRKTREILGDKNFLVQTDWIILPN